MGWVRSRNFQHLFICFHLIHNSYTITSFTVHFAFDIFIVKLTRPTSNSVFFLFYPRLNIIRAHLTVIQQPRLSSPCWLEAHTVKGCVKEIHLLNFLIIHKSNFKIDFILSIWCSVFSQNKTLYSTSLIFSIILFVLCILHCIRH